MQRATVAPGGDGDFSEQVASQIGGLYEHFRKLYQGEHGIISRFRNRYQDGSGVASLQGGPGLAACAANDGSLRLTAARHSHAQPRIQSDQLSLSEWGERPPPKSQSAFCQTAPTQQQRFKCSRRPAVLASICTAAVLLILLIVLLAVFLSPRPGTQQATTSSNSSTPVNSISGLSPDPAPSLITNPTLLGVGESALRMQLMVTAPAQVHYIVFLDTLYARIGPGKHLAFQNPTPSALFTDGKYQEPLSSFKGGVVAKGNFTVADGMGSWLIGRPPDAPQQVKSVANYFFYVSNSIIIGNCV